MHDRSSFPSEGQKVTGTFIIIPPGKNYGSNVGIEILGSLYSSCSRQTFFSDGLKGFAKGFTKCINLRRDYVEKSFLYKVANFSNDPRRKSHLQQTSPYHRILR